MSIEKVLWFTTDFIDYAKKIKEFTTKIYIPDFLHSEIEEKDLFIPLSAASIKFPEDFMNDSFKNFDMFVVNIPELNSSWDEKTLLEKIETSFSVLVKQAVKNYRDIIVVTNEKTLQTVIKNLEECGDVPLQDRRRMALESMQRLIDYYVNLYKLLSETFASEKFEYLLLKKLQPLEFNKNVYKDVELLKIQSKQTFFENVEFLNNELLSIEDIKVIHTSMKILENLSENSCALISGDKIEFISSNASLEYNIQRILDYAKSYKVSSASIAVNGKVDKDILKIINSNYFSTVIARNFENIEILNDLKLFKIPEISLVKNDVFYQFLDSLVIKYENKLHDQNVPSEKLLNIFKKLQPKAALIAVNSEIFFLSSYCISDYEAIENAIYKFSKVSVSEPISEVVLVTNSIPDDAKLLKKLRESGVEKAILFEELDKLKTLNLR